MRTLPDTKLVKSFEPLVPGSNEWIVQLKDTTVTNAPLGFVYCPRVRPGTRPPADPWNARGTVKGGPSKDLGWYRTRREAVGHVVMHYQAGQDEIEAHRIMGLICEAQTQAATHAQEQREITGHDLSHLVIEYADQKVVLNDDHEKLTTTLHTSRQAVSNLLNGRAKRDDWSDYLQRLSYGIRMIELELARRERQVRYTADLPGRTRISPSTLRLMQSEFAVDPRTNKLKPDDSLLVRDLHLALVTPWKLTTAELDTLLARVRELEKRALDVERRRPASMVVEIKDDVLKRVATLERQYELLKARTTMLLAGVVTALDEDEETMVKVLREQFAVTIDDFPTKG
jgi:hypothetical protein